MKAVSKKNILMMVGTLIIVMFCFGAKVYASTPKVNSVVVCGNPTNHTTAKQINDMFKSNTYAGYLNNAYPDPYLYDSDKTPENGGGIYRRRVFGQSRAGRLGRHPAVRQA